GARGGRHVGVVRAEAVRALADVPPVVAAAHDGGDLLPQVLPRIADEEGVAAAGVEGEPPGVAEAVGVDLVEAVAADEGVVWGDAVGHAAVDVEAEDLAEEVLLDGLPVPTLVGVVPVLDVAGADV